MQTSMEGNNRKRAKYRTGSLMSAHAHPLWVSLVAPRRNISFTGTIRHLTQQQLHPWSSLFWWKAFRIIGFGLLLLLTFLWIRFHDELNPANVNNEYQYQQISESDQSSSARPITIASTIHSPTKKESASDVEPKILVVYSGPSTLTEGDPDKNMLYLRNLEYFLLHGLDCATQDTIVVLGYDVAKQYRHQITQLNLACQRQHYSQSHTITLVERENECYDMESVRLVMHGNITNILDYDYFIYVNCGTTGPMMPQKETHIPWTRKFIERLVGNVKMVGLSHVCLQYKTHIQSMVFALDQVSMKIILDSDCVYDCRPYKQINQSEIDFVNDIIGRYEVQMGQLILDKGFAIESLTRPKALTKENRDNCTDEDMWLTTRLHELYGRIPSLEDVLFFKTSRVLTPEMAVIINFTGSIWWNW